MDIPYSDIFEKSVLSCMLQGYDEPCIDELTDDHFFGYSNKIIFHQHQKTHNKELASFTQTLIDLDILDKIGGPSKLTEIYTYTPTDAHLGYHVKQLHILKARRHAIKAAEEIIEAARDMSDAESFITLSGANMSLVSDIASAASNTRPKKLIMSELMATFEKRIKGESSPMGWSSGLNSLNKAIMGIHPQRLIVISGFPTSGKTVLAIQICWELAKQNIPSLIISLEMPDHKIAERNLIMASDLPARAISDPLEYSKESGNQKPTIQHLRNVQIGINSIMQMPIHFEDPTGANINQIVAIIRRNAKEHDIRAVAVDYIQLIRGNSKSFSKEQEVAEISHAFQALAKELKIVIILLSQQNQDGDTKHSKAISEDADAIFTIVQKENTDGEKEHIGN